MNTRALVATLIATGVMTSSTATSNLRTTADTAKTMRTNGTRKVLISQ